MFSFFFCQPQCFLFEFEHSEYFAEVSTIVHIALDNTGHKVNAHVCCFVQLKMFTHVATVLKQLSLPLIPKIRFSVHTRYKYLVVNTPYLCDTCNLFVAFRTCLELLEVGADPNKLVAGEGIAPIHLAVGLQDITDSRDITEAILAMGGDPNVRYDTISIIIVIVGIIIIVFYCGHILLLCHCVCSRPTYCILLAMTY